MTAAGCAAHTLEVYSHRALGGPSSPGVPDAVVSEKTIRVLHRAGIRSFDLDLFWSEDGHLFVGHPVALRQVWRHQLNESRSWKHSKSVFSLSADEVRRAARSEAILEVPRLLEIARELRLSLALDLKGAARNRFSAHLRWLADEVIRRELERSVVIWVPSVTFAKQLQRAPNGPLRLARPLLDRPAAGQPACGGTLTTDDAKRFAVLGPSVRCLKSPALQAQLAPWRKAPRGLVVWVVDTLDDAVAVARAGATNVVSNVPGQLRANLTAKCRVGYGAGGPVL